MKVKWKKDEMKKSEMKVKWKKKSAKKKKVKCNSNANTPSGAARPGADLSCLRQYTRTGSREIRMRKSRVPSDRLRVPCGIGCGIETITASPTNQISFWIRLESAEARDLSQKTRLIELVSAISTVCHVIATNVRFYRNTEKSTDLCVLADFSCVGKFWKRVFLEFIWTFGVYPFYLKNKTVMVLQKMYEMIPSVL